jgi:ADP-L-glycero-D-manno-heptose 6-epimerase
MKVVTGAAGFIGSALLSALSDAGMEKLIAVDDFGRLDKNKNLLHKRTIKLIHRDDFIDWLQDHASEVEFVFHLGARTDTAEQDEHLFDKLNLNYSKEVWSVCSQYHIPLIYASSAATYGLGENGYSDDHSSIPALTPLNPYGWSKQKFDLWVLCQETSPPDWYGFKFFNVYGPNEYHKGRMASVVMHTFNQIGENGKMKLFRSHRDDIEDGYQSRDFVYIKDVLNVLLYVYENRPVSGIYNLGTGRARTFLDLAKAVFRSMGREEKIEFIDTPEDIRDTYQYFTQADMDKLIQAGYDKPFTDLEEGVRDYVTGYLSDMKYF